MSRWIGAGALLVLLSWSAIGSGAPSERPSVVAPEAAVGVVVQVTGDEIFVDLGRAQGAVAGDRMRVYRRVEVEHPVTKKKLTDYFLLGVLALTDVGDRLSFARFPADLMMAHDPVIGDMVELIPSAPAPDVPEEAPSAEPGDGDATVNPESADVLRTVEGEAPLTTELTCPRCLSDADALAVHEVWRRTLGRTLEERRDLWVVFLADHPDSPYAGRIGQEIDWLDDLVTWARRIPRVRTEILAVHRPPEELEEGLAFDVSVTITPPEDVQRVVLHTRGDEEEDFASRLLESSGDFAWSGRVPREAVGPGFVEYFVEVVNTSGAVVATWRNAREPYRVEIREPAVAPDERWGRSRARIRTEYVDFYLQDAGLDSYWKMETDYAYRVNDWLTAVRVGVGLIAGQGGPKDRITLPKEHEDYEKPRSLATTYAFLELEFELHEYFAVLARGIAGSLRDAPDDEDDGDTMLGFRGAFRIGRDRGTNLVAHYTVGQALGMEGGLALRLALLERFPMGAEVLVTNFPVGGDDVGVRIIGQAGWRPVDWFEVGLRLGYDIRDINHSGATFGLDLAFDW